MRQTCLSEKVPIFKVKEMHLYDTGGMFYVNVRLAIDLSLAKLVKAIIDLRHRLAIKYNDINLLSWLGKTTSATPRLVIKDRECRNIILSIYQYKVVKNSWFCSACK